MTRTKLDEERPGISHSVTIGGDTKLYIQTGEYEDGTVGEVWVKVDKEGGPLRVYDVLATMVSIALQHKVPLKSIVGHLKGQRMNPQGVTDNKAIPTCSSIADYVGKWLEKRYL